MNEKLNKGGKRVLNVKIQVTTNVGVHVQLIRNIIETLGGG